MIRPLPRPSITSCRKLSTSSKATGPILRKWWEMGRNLALWQLGPGETIGCKKIQGTGTTFATAHELLARRCVTNPRDFFHALLRLLEIDITEPHLSVDQCRAMQQVVKSCIEGRDFSPLFMIPISVQSTRRYGYLDCSRNF